MITFRIWRWKAVGKYAYRLTPEQNFRLLRIWLNVFQPGRAPLTDGTWSVLTILSWKGVI